MNKKYLHILVVVGIIYLIFRSSTSLQNSFGKKFPNAYNFLVNNAIVPDPRYS